MSEETAPNEEKFLFVDFSLVHSRMKVVKVELTGSLTSAGEAEVLEQRQILRRSGSMYLQNHHTGLAGE